jgi:hypothetical protein
MTWRREILKKVFLYFFFDLILDFFKNFFKYYFWMKFLGSPGNSNCKMIEKLSKALTIKLLKLFWKSLKGKTRKRKVFPINQIFQWKLIFNFSFNRYQIKKKFLFLSFSLLQQLSIWSHYMMCCLFDEKGKKYIEQKKRKYNWKTFFTVD